MHSNLTRNFLRVLSFSPRELVNTTHYQYEHTYTGTYLIVIILIFYYTFYINILHIAVIENLKHFVL